MLIFFRFRSVTNVVSTFLKIPKDRPPIFVNVLDGTDELISALSNFPITLRKFSITKDNKIKDDSETTPYWNPVYLAELIRTFIRQIIFGISESNTLEDETCIIDTISPYVNVLNNIVNIKNISKYQPTFEEFKKGVRSTPYCDNPYNPLYRKMLINNHKNLKHEDTQDTGNSKDKIRQHDNNIEMKRCEGALFLKAALRASVQNFSKDKLVLIVEDTHLLSTDFIRFVFSIALKSLTLICFKIRIF